MDIMLKKEKKNPFTKKRVYYSPFLLVVSCSLGKENTPKTKKNKKKRNFNNYNTILKIKKKKYKKKSQYYCVS